MHTRTVGPHPDGYHKDAEAKARCYACSHPEKLIPSEADRAKARELVAAGYQSVSNKYRTVAKGPFAASLRKVTDILIVPRDLPDWFGEDLQRWFDGMRGHWTRMHPADQQTLTPSEYIAFREAGGETAF